MKTMDSEKKYPDPKHPRYMAGLAFHQMENTKPSPEYDLLDDYLLITTDGKFIFYEIAIWNGITWFRMDATRQVVAWAHLPKGKKIIQRMQDTRR